MRSGVNFTGALTVSPNTELELLEDSDTFMPGLVLELAAIRAHLRLLDGSCAEDSQSRFLLRVAHAIFFLRPLNVLYDLMEQNIFLLTVNEPKFVK